MLCRISCINLILPNFFLIILIYMVIIPVRFVVLTLKRDYKVTQTLSNHLIFNLILYNLIFLKSTISNPIFVWGDNLAKIPSQQPHFTP